MEFFFPGTNFPASAGIMVIKARWHFRETGFTVDDLKDLVTTSRKGSLEAFGSVVERLGSRAINYAFHLTGNRADAEDAAQESFLQAWRKLGSLRDESAFLGWFYRILSNTVKKKFRDSRAMENIEDCHCLAGSPEGEPQVVAEARERQKRVREAIGELPLHYRSVLILRDMDDFSYEEIAQVLGIPLGTVKSRLSAARERMCRILSEVEGNVVP